MGKMPEASINKVLDVLRSQVDQASLRRLDDGRLVADIVPRNPHRWSLSHFLAQEANLMQGTVSIRLAKLVKAGFIERGSTHGVKKRWVVMEGAFRYSDFES